MVKIRLQRIGTKARPFYRVVVTKSSAGRGGAFVEVVGTYNPVPTEKRVDIKNDRALYWLMQGAVPTETAAVLLKKVGVMEEFLKARPNQAAKYKFLDKRVAATSTKTVIDAPAAVAVAEPEAPAAVEEVAAEAPAEAVAETTEEA